jgi:nicotinamidase-related amidase
MLLEKDKSCVLLIDVQEKLTPLVREPQALIARCQWLIRLAKDLNVPRLASEQYPSGLGPTVEPLRSLVSADEFVDKVEFSCLRAQAFKQRLQSLHKKQLVLMGIETHVCVLQTAFDLQEADFDVFVVVDAVSSRSELDYRFGLQRMEQNGIHLITAEMVFFEWIGQAGTPQFKALSKAYLRSTTGESK